MKTYIIKQCIVQDDPTMLIIDRETRSEIAEYRLTVGQERREIAAMRRTIDRHLSKPGGTLGNYQW
jgi:hypothetical protein